MPTMPTTNRIRRGRAAAALLLGAALAAAPRPAGAQQITDARTLAARVAAVKDGKAHLTYALRPGVCGSGGNIRTRSESGRDASVRGWSERNDDVTWDETCEPGPGRLVVEVRGGEPTRTRVYVGGRWRDSSRATDLGEVPAAVVQQWLLGLAERSDSRAAREAIFPATIANAPEPWPTLLRIARDSRRPRETRTQAVFWLGQAAGEAATRELKQLAVEDTIDREIKQQVVFALSRRPKAEAVPALIDVARTHRDPEVRRTALFWLAKQDDPRALEFIEKLVMR